jgi:hypothetical protein
MLRTSTWTNRDSEEQSYNHRTSTKAAEKDGILNKVKKLLEQNAEI